MSRTSFMLTDALDAYVAAHVPEVDDVKSDLIIETAGLPAAGMQISPALGAFLALLVRLLSARRVLEIGTFTGLSTLYMAEALPEGGLVLACDVSDEWTRIASRYWDRAGIADRIDLRLAPAELTLGRLPGDEVFDMAFIDADKPGYPAYWELVVPRIRPGGLVVADNTLWGGSVADSGAGESVDALREFNDLALADDRVEAMLLPVFDGLLLARRL